jgi:hypothetical protein
MFNYALFIHQYGNPLPLPIHVHPVILTSNDLYPLRSPPINQISDNDRVRKKRVRRKRNKACVKMEEEGRKGKREMEAGRERREEKRYQ